MQFALRCSFGMAPNPTTSCLKERCAASHLEGWRSLVAPPGASFEAAPRRLRTRGLGVYFVPVFGAQAFENARSPPKPPAAADARATDRLEGASDSEMAPQAIGIARNRLENGRRQAERVLTPIPAATPAAQPEQPRPPALGRRRRADKCRVGIARVRPASPRR
jgi:hypothetical protein